MLEKQFTVFPGCRQSYNSAGKLACPLSGYLNYASVFVNHVVYIG